MLNLYIAKEIANISAFFLNTQMLFCKFCKMADRWKYKTNPNSFCYVGEKYILLADQQNIAHKMKTEYKYYFGCKVDDPDKKWALHICCNSCNILLLR